MNRREFIAAVLPSDGALQKLRRALVWAFYLFCCYLAFRLFAGVPAKGWKILGGIALAFVTLTVAISFLLISMGNFFRRHGSPRVLAAMKRVGQGVPLVSFMALGALLHDLWIRKPEEALIAVSVSLLMAVAARFDRRSSS